MYRKVLLCYDGSLEGRRALREGAEIARVCQAGVSLLAVIPPFPGLALSEGVLPESFLETESEEIRTILKEGVHLLHELGLEAEGMIAWGDPVDRISAHARDIEADLIVIGHRRRAPLARWWQGSVGKSLLDYAGCSILVAMNDLQPPATP